MSIFNVIGTPYKGTHTLGNWQSDNAYDIGMPIGTPVHAVISGKITKVGSLGADPGSRFAGQRVQIEASDGQAVWYGHLSATQVSVGQEVTAGDEIGLSGSANGVAHLHFAALKNPGQYLAELTGKAGDAAAGTASNVVSKVGGTIGGAVSGAAGAAKDVATGAAAGVAKDVVTALWGAVSADGARALLYALLVLGGTALAVVGISRASGLGQAVKQSAKTTTKVAAAVL